MRPGVFWSFHSVFFYYQVHRGQFSLLIRINYYMPWCCLIGNVIASFYCWYNECRQRWGGLSPAGLFFFFFFFSLSFPENYRLVIFVVDMSTSLLFLLIFNFYHFNSLKPYRSQSTKNSRFLTVNMGRNLF